MEDSVRHARTWTCAWKLRTSPSSKQVSGFGVEGRARGCRVPCHLRPPHAPASGAGAPGAASSISMEQDDGRPKLRQQRTGACLDR